MANEKKHKLRGLQQQENLKNQLIPKRMAIPPNTLDHLMRE